MENSTDIKNKKHFFCKKCGVEIIKERYEAAVAAQWIPLCDVCEPEIREKLKEWEPKFREFQSQGFTL